MAYDASTYQAPAWASNLQGFTFMPAASGAYIAGNEELFANSPFANLGTPGGATGDATPTDWGGLIPAGYQIGFHKKHNYARQVMVDQAGNVVGSWEGPAYDSLRGSDYATIAAGLTAGYGLAGGFGALGAGGAAGADTAALGAGQVGAMDAGVAGLEGAAGGGFAAPGGAASLYAPTGYAAGTGSALTGTGSGLAATAAAPTAAGLNWPALIKSGIGLVGGLAGANAQGNAAQKASGIQQQAATAGQAQLVPYATAGTGALSAQQDLLGLNGADAQAKAIAALQASPQFTSQQKLGEDRILANASATGGLRGGNVQTALAQFSPALLSQIISDQYTRLGGLTNTGLSAAGGVSNLIQQGGAAAAGGALANGQTQAGYWNAATNALGLYFGLNGGW